MVTLMAQINARQAMQVYAMVPRTAAGVGRLMTLPSGLQLKLFAGQCHRTVTGPSEVSAKLSMQESVRLIAALADGPGPQMTSSSGNLRRLIADVLPLQSRRLYLVANVR